MCEVVRGYHRQCPLSETELEVFFTLACTRLAVSVCMSATQYRLEPENDYLTVSAAGAWTCLRPRLLLSSWTQTDIRVSINSMKLLGSRMSENFYTGKN
jgi:Ser/Thr protein kinase RdoA (MazF antagonist)